jgi:hypothetical protein
VTDTPQLAFIVDGHDDPAIEIRVNFGPFAGRPATPAEIDALAHTLLAEIEDVTIVAEDRHEVDATVEAAVHQVRIEVDAADAPADPGSRTELAERVREQAEQWARTCVAERPFDAADL